MTPCKCGALGTWPWKASRICRACLILVDHPERAKREGPFCSYCNSADGIEQCCLDHAHTLICKWCRAAAGRTKTHRSPLEGRACCGTTKDSNPDCDICGRGKQRRKAKK